MNLPNLKDAKIRTKDKVKIIKNDYNVPLRMKNFGLNKKYYIKTYGCQMNVHDSENIKAILEDMGFKESKELEEASIIILNTCAIRENAHNKMFGFLGRVKHLKEEKKDIICGICGCMAQEEKVVDEIKSKYKWVDIVFGTHNLHKLPNILEEAINKNKQEIDVFSIEGNVYENIPVKRDSKYKAWVNIMYGCDKFCTYCIVPYTRGKQRSRLKEDILNEIKDLVDSGYKEVTLLGQNVNAYGKDLNMDYNMSNLLEDTAKLGIERIRFVTSHPWDFTQEMIDVIAKYDNIMPYIHLPLQSGSDKILKLMGRRYTKEQYINLFNTIKEKIPNVSITTDIIVAFPGETEEDFNDTLDVVNKCKFDSAFTFIYSPRVGTPAASMKNDLTEDLKNKRLYKLNEIINEYANKINNSYLNKIVPVLLEDFSEKEGKLMGYTDTMKLVNVACDKKYLGKIVNVKITGAKTWSLDGKIVEK